MSSNSPTTDNVANNEETVSFSGGDHCSVNGGDTDCTSLSQEFTDQSDGELWSVYLWDIMYSSTHLLNQSLYFLSLVKRGGNLK